MLIRKSQTALLKQILAQLHDDLVIKEELLTHLYTILFHLEAEVLEVADPELQASMEFLRELMETEQLKTLDEVLSYFEEEKNGIGDFITDMMDRVDEETAVKDDRRTIVFISSSFEDHSNERWHLFMQGLHTHIWDDNKWMLPHHGSYVRASKTYLHQFTEDNDRDRVFIWHGSAFEEIQRRHVSDVFWKVDRKCPTQMSKCSWLQKEIEMTFNYDKLVEQISEEMPIADISIKMGLTNLLCWSKSYYTEWDHDECKPSNMLIFDCVDKHKQMERSSGEIFESWIAEVFNTMLADKYWSILKSPKDHSWLTSDNPGFVVEKDATGAIHAEAEHIWSKLRSKPVRFYYPLSKDYCLRIQPPDNSGPDESIYIAFEHSSEAEWQEINEHTVSTRHEMVIASDKKMIEPFQSAGE